MMFARYLSSTLFTLVCLGFSATNSHATPAQVVVSIKPLHSLVSQLTRGVNQTQLLLSQQQSPHDFQLRPSQKRMLNRADIFIYSSDSIESFVPALKNTQQDMQFIQLDKLPKIKVLPLRSFHSHQQNKSLHTDGHIWLSIDNAKIISRSISDILIKHSPENAKKYSANLNSLLLKLETLQQDNARLLRPYKNSAYLVYHDAFQYFEVENKLSGAHFVTSSPEHSPGIKRVKALRQLITDENIQCVFYEPPHIPALLHTLIENKSAKLFAIDPVGSQIPMGEQHYFTLLRQTATQLDACFKRTSK